MAPDFYTIANMKCFRLSDSEFDYKIKQLTGGNYALYVSNGASLEMVGHLTFTDYSFIINKRVQGLMLKKEIAFSEVK